MSWIVELQKLLPWISGLPLLPKLFLSLIIVAMAAFVLALIWTPLKHEPARVQSIPRSIASEAVPEGSITAAVDPVSQAEQIRVTLDGYDRRVFPDGLHELNIVYDRGGIDGNFLGKLGNQIDGFQAMGRPTTSDGYAWFWSMTFKTKGGTLALLFPWSSSWEKNWGRPKGLAIDRSIAVYTTGDVTMGEGESLIREVTRGLRLR